MSALREKPDVQELRRIALLLLACLPVFLVFRMQVKYWVNIPIWDEWDTPGRTLLHFAQGKLAWSDFWAQHNESRKVFPRLIYLAINGPFGWDVRYGMVLTSLIAGTVSVFFLRQLRDPGMRSSGGVLFAWLLINFLLFGPSQSENYLCGYTFEILIPVLALCGCIAVNLSGRPLVYKVLWNSVLAIIATFSFAHGMILWLLGLPIPATQETARPRWIRRWAFYLLVYGLVGALT
ncbi:MAG TPA: hypothetical protein VJS88_03840, partial [Chthoniobacterales bacterium]|nr:hypothetical protein [Chthoniobacterales bacterium]